MSISSVLIAKAELMPAKVQIDGARRTYEAMAAAYDAFTAHHDYEGWLADLVSVLERHGLSGRRLLDVGCGTGKSFLSMLPHGWRVTGCDISPAMLALAREKVDESIELVVADMRELPRFGEFDLVWALDDTINYLLSVDELVDALRGMRNNLASEGLLLFDVNELLAYRTAFAERWAFEQNKWRFTYKGQESGDVASGSICESRLRMERCDDGFSLNHRANLCAHRQRHFPEVEVLGALERAGLDCLDVYGHGIDGIPRQPLDPSEHTKAIYVSRLPSS